MDYNLSDADPGPPGVRRRDELELPICWPGLAKPPGRVIVTATRANMLAEISHGVRRRFHQSVFNRRGRRGSQRARVDLGGVPAFALREVAPRTSSNWPVICPTETAVHRRHREGTGSRRPAATSQSGTLAAWRYLDTKAGNLNPERSGAAGAARSSASLDGPDRRAQAPARDDAARRVRQGIREVGDGTGDGVGGDTEEGWRRIGQSSRVQGFKGFKGSKGSKFQSPRA